MKLKLLLSIIVLGLCTATTNIYSQFVVKVKPSFVIKARPHAPSNGHIWIEPEWVWRNGNYVMIDGYWAPARKGFVYAPGHWKRKKHGYFWVAGYWKRR